MALPIYQGQAQSAAQQYGVPWPIFAGMISHESGWNQSAIGSAGEIGLGQLKAATAADLGVNPYDAGQNLLGAAKYLRQQFDTFGNWSDALGAYNQGARGYQGGGHAAGSRYAQAVLGAAGQFGDAGQVGGTQDGGQFSLSYGPDAAPGTSPGAGSIGSSGGTAAGAGGLSGGAGGDATAGALGGIGGALQSIADTFKNFGKIFTGEFWAGIWAWAKEQMLVIAFVLLALLLLLAGGYRIVTAGTKG